MRIGRVGYVHALRIPTDVPPFSFVAALPVLIPVITACSLIQSDNSVQVSVTNRSQAAQSRRNRWVVGGKVPSDTRLVHTQITLYALAAALLPFFFFLSATAPNPSLPTRTKLRPPLHRHISLPPSALCFFPLLSIPHYLFLPSHASSYPRLSVYRKVPGKVKERLLCSSLGFVQYWSAFNPVVPVRHPYVLLLHATSPVSFGVASRTTTARPLIAVFLSILSKKEFIEEAYDRPLNFCRENYSKAPLFFSCQFLTGFGRPERRLSGGKPFPASLLLLGGPRGPPLNTSRTLDQRL